MMKRWLLKFWVSDRVSVAPVEAKFHCEIHQHAKAKVLPTKSFMCLGELDTNKTYEEMRINTMWPEKMQIFGSVKPFTKAPPDS